MFSIYKARHGIVLTFIIIALILPMQSSAAQCLSRTCVDVYVENGKIVIEGRKGSGKKSTKQVQKKVAIPKRATVTTPRRTPVGPVIKKTTPRKRVSRRPIKRVAPARSLSDKLVKLLPTGAIAKQPYSSALVNVPVIYWSDLPSVFRTKVAIVGEVVDVTMRPSFLWSFGDGRFFATTSAGGPYPNEKIAHAYGRSGIYVVTMLATWGGMWSHNGVARAITGKIRKLSVATVTITNGPTRITK